MGAFSSDSLGQTLNLTDQQVDNFEARVTLGEYIEIEPGKFMSREAATDPLAALADAHSKGRPDRRNNVQGHMWQASGGGDESSIARFLGLLGSSKHQG